VGFGKSTRIAHQCECDPRHVHHRIGDQLGAIIRPGKAPSDATSTNAPLLAFTGCRFDFWWFRFAFQPRNSKQGPQLFQGFQTWQRVLSSPSTDLRASDFHRDRSQHLHVAPCGWSCVSESAATALSIVPEITPLAWAVAPSNFAFPAQRHRSQGTVPAQCLAVMFPVISSSSISIFTSLEVTS